MLIRRPRRAIAMALLAMCLAACSTMGNKKLADVDEPYVKQVLSAGKGDKKDIAEIFGQPQDRIKFADGNEVWVFSYSKYTPKPQNFINVGGLFRAQNNYDKELVMLFDRQGKVRQWKLSTNQQDEATGLLNQPLPATN